MAFIRFFALGLVLGFLAAWSTQSVACSDPAQHKIHLQQQMEEAQRRQAAGGGNQAPSAPSAPKSNLDSADSFFGAVGSAPRDGAPGRDPR